MHRLRSALLLGGLVLLASYISAPAAPTPKPAPVSSEMMAAVEQNAPAANEAVQETARLRARLAAVPERKPPQRDPFSFGGSTKTPRRTPAPQPEPIAAVPLEETAVPIAWPKLVALLTDKGAVTAALGIGDGVEMVKAGETHGGFLIRDISASSIEVVHIASSEVMRLTLR